MPYSWENRLKISIFGRSHEKEIGAELSGIPAGERIDYAALQAFMRRRAPGYSEYTTIRHGSNTAARRTCAAEELSPDA